MLDDKAFRRVDDARFEDESRAGLVDINVGTVRDLLNQLQQINLVLKQTRILIVRSDAFDDDLSARQHAE